MKITVTIDTVVERADGTVSRSSETTVAHAGDNPRFETAELVTAIDQALQQRLAKLDAEPTSVTAG